MSEHTPKVNLNTATPEELGKVKGVGDECARRIIAERERRGGFKDVAEMDSMELAPQAIRHLKEHGTV